jgi:hypothetical protein
MNLKDSPLLPNFQAWLDRLAATATGPVVWRMRKVAEARDLLALSQRANRLRIQELDLRESLRALLHLRVPVACRPGADGELVVGREVLLGLTYPQQAICQQLPGYAFFQILAPHHVWHANVSPDPVQALCLGTKLPAGIRVLELVLMAYGALSMQTVQIDERDAAGVLHAEAALWWQRNMHRIPLSRAPFLSSKDD